MVLPRSTPKHITLKHGSAFCQLCRDVFNKPLPIDPRNIHRHVNTRRHIENRAKRDKPGVLKSSPRQSGGPPELVPLTFESPTPHFEGSGGADKRVIEGVDNVGSEGDGDEGDWEDESDDEDGLRANDLPDHFADCTCGQPAKSTPHGAACDISLDPDEEFGLELDELDHGDTWTTNASKQLNCHVPGVSSPSTNSVWFPYQSKPMFLADVLWNCRRLHFSRAQMYAVLEYARQSGAKGVPSLSALQKVQEELKNRTGNPEQRHVAPGGTVYYINKISESLKQDMANPHVRKHMNFFPHIDGKRMSQGWHGRKMVHDIDDDFLTPCIRINGRIFYVNELVQRANDWFLPRRWVTRGPTQELHAIGHIVVKTESGLKVQHARRTLVRVASFVRSYPELQALGAVPEFDDESKPFKAKMPNPLREVAGSRPIYSIPLIVFMDDASGNNSKQWNKHHACYLSNAALPREVLQAEYNVRFVTASSHASPSELIHGVCASIEEAFSTPTVAYDCLTGQEVLIRPFPLFWAGDNPMQAEHCSGSGLNSNHFCRTCTVGGNEEFKRSLKGYPTLFKSGEMRAPSKTRELVNERLEMTLKPRMIVKIQDHARDSGIKDPVAQSIIDRMLALNKALHQPANKAARLSPDQISDILRQKLDSARKQGCMNPLLTMRGVNIHRDTPTEILHTVLLGVVKYFWGQSVYIMAGAKRMSTFESRLASVSLSGLDLPTISARYICTYTGGLIGRHFKALVQVMPFLCYDILPPDVLTAWLLLGRLTSLLWYTEIENVDVYTDELEKLIADFLLITARCSPSIIVLKPKFHFLVHLPDYIRRFGPSLLFSTERFESFNGVFRAASMFSNRQAPSRDISRRFASIERVKHVASGGYWRERGKWVCANSTLLEFVARNKIFNKLIGVPSNTSSTPGFVGSRAKPLVQSWSQLSRRTGIAKITPPGTDCDRYQLAELLISQSGDTVRAGSDVVYHGSLFGHVKVIFGCTTIEGGLIFFAVLETYVLGQEKHPLLDMPTAKRSGKAVCVPVKDIICLVNMQHDCATEAKCTNTRAVFEVQEREETSHVQHRVQHNNDTHFIINIQGLHNALHIRRAILADLYLRTPLVIDQQEIFRLAVRSLEQRKAQKVKLAAARRDAKNIISEALDDVPTEDAGEPSEQVRATWSKRKAKSAPATETTPKRPRRTGVSKS